MASLDHQRGAFGAGLSPEAAGRIRQAKAAVADPRVPRRDPADLGGLAACIGLLYIAVPAASGVSSEAKNGLAAGAAYCTALMILARLAKFGRLGLWVVGFVFAYFVGGVFFPGDAADATNQVVSTFVVGSAIMLFSLYGKQMLDRLWFRQLAGILAVAGIAGVLIQDHPKNITGGAVIYLLTIVAFVLIYDRPQRGLAYALVLFVTSGIVAILADFRSMAAYALVMLIAYWGSAFLSFRAYWWSGVMGCVAVVGSLTWFFLHTTTSPLAVAISREIAQTSGRRATSGREFLWPAIVHEVQDSRWTGSGVGTLPRDFLPTTLSSHSFYMQVYLQLGLIGIALLVGVLLAVWKPLALATSRPARFGSAVFLMFVLHNSTEVLAFQIGLIASLPAWCVIALAYSIAREEIKNRPTLLRRRERRDAVVGATRAQIAVQPRYRPSGLLHK